MTLVLQPQFPIHDANELRNRRSGMSRRSPLVKRAPCASGYQRILKDILVEEGGNDDYLLRATWECPVGQNKGILKHSPPSRSISDREAGSRSTMTEMRERG